MKSCPLYVCLQYLLIASSNIQLQIKRYFICNHPAKECGYSRPHSVEELQSEISKRTKTYFEG